MPKPYQIVCSIVVFELQDPAANPISIRVKLRYDTRDPFAVTAVFPGFGAYELEWIFARELMAAGLICDAGLGDIRFRRSLTDLDSMVVELDSPDGHAEFAVAVEELTDFLNRTYGAVPPGAECRWLDIDCALASLLPSE